MLVTENNIPPPTNEPSFHSPMRKITLVPDELVPINNSTPTDLNDIHFIVLYVNNHSSNNSSNQTNRILNETLSLTSQLENQRKNEFCRFFRHDPPSINGIILRLTTCFLVESNHGP